VMWARSKSLSLTAARLVLPPDLTSEIPSSLVLTRPLAVGAALTSMHSDFLPGVTFAGSDGTTPSLVGMYCCSSVGLVAGSS
jgi:hypothetical protein